MTFADIALNDEFKQDGVVYTKLTEATAYTSRHRVGAELALAQVGTVRVRGG